MTGKCEISANLFNFGKPVLNKRGNIHHREEKVETCFRLVVIKTKKTKNFGLTNEFELSAKEIADYYRKRSGY